MSPTLFDSWARWSVCLGSLEFCRRNCLAEWRKFRPRTEWDKEGVERARGEEKRCREVLKRAEEEEEATKTTEGDDVSFKVFKARGDLERARRGEGFFDKDLWENVAFLPLEKRKKKEKTEKEKEKEELIDNDVSYESDFHNASLLDAEDAEEYAEEDAEEEIDSCLHVPSLICNSSIHHTTTTTTTPATENTTRGPTIKAEVHLGDKVLLAINAIPGSESHSFGHGTDVDTPMVLQARAEKSFFGGAASKGNGNDKLSKTKAIHSAVRADLQSRSELVWVVVLEFNPLLRRICVSDAPVKKWTPKLNSKNTPCKWIGVGGLWGAWCWREEEEDGDGNKLFRLPAGDMYWGIATLKECLDEAAENVNMQDRGMRAKRTSFCEFFEISHWRAHYPDQDRP